jgi:flagellar assembly protein FliH
MLSQPLRAELFLFPDNFEEPKAASRLPPPPAPEPPPPPTFSEAELAAARAAGFEAGRQAGRAQAAEGTRATVAATVATIARKLDDAAAAAGEVAEDSANALLGVLLATLGVCLPVLRAKHGEAELRHFINAVLPGLVRQPHVSVQVHPSLVAAVTQELAVLPRHGGPTPTIEACPEIPPGDAVVFWEDGRAVRDSAAAWAAVIDVLRPLGLTPTEPVPAMIMR